MGEAAGGGSVTPQVGVLLFVLFAATVIGLVLMFTPNSRR